MKPPPLSALPGTLDDPLYPDSDDRRKDETGFHSAAKIHLWWALRHFFSKVNDVYVTSNLMFYFEQGNPRRRRAPDILVARGVGKHLRRSYRVWEEGVLPCALIELVSKRSWKVDVGLNRWLYAKLRVDEYFVFDPEGTFLDPVLRGFRCRDGHSVRLKAAQDGSLVSKQLGLRLVPEGGMLRLVDLKTGEEVPTRDARAEREREKARLESERAERERKNAEALAVENEALRAEMERLRRSKS